jgi:hypothetical protein
MVGLLFRLFEHVLVGACLSSLSLALFGITACLRLLPRFLHLARLGLRGFLVLSFRLYYRVLSHLAPAARRHLRIDILTGGHRVAASASFSLVLGLLLVLILGRPVTGWSLGLSLLHGLFVGLVWDDIEEPGGFRLGVNTQ